MKRIILLLTSLIVISFCHAQLLVQLPEANLFTISGKICPTSSISNFDKPTIVITYFSSCEVCLNLIDSLNYSYEKQKAISGVKIVVISIDKEESESNVSTKADKRDWSSFQILHDKNGEFSTAIHSTRAPKIFFLDANQNVVYCMSGFNATISKIYGLAKLIGEKQITADKLFFDENWFPCLKSNAAYYRNISKSDNGKYHVEDFFMSGQAQMVADYSMLYPEIVDGQYLTYYENGAKETKGKYADGLKTGAWTTWYIDGTVMFKKIYANGSENGLATLYYANGKKENEGNFLNGREDGVWNFYYENGTKKRETVWDEGARKICTGWYGNGKVEYRISRFDNDNNLILRYTSLYYENGKKEMILSFDNDSNVTEIRQYFESGKLKSVLKLNELDESRYGFTQYFENGNKQMTFTMNQNQEANGKLLRWSENGQKNLEVNFKEDMPSGIAMKWFDNGSVEEKVDFDSDAVQVFGKDGSSGKETDSFLFSLKTNAGKSYLWGSSIYFYNNFLDDDLYSN